MAAEVLVSLHRARVSGLCEAFAAEFGGGARRLWGLRVQRLPVPDAAAHELGPFRHDDDGVQFLRQQVPQVRMVPAQLLPTGVAVRADPLAQADYLGKQLLPRER